MASGGIRPGRGAARTRFGRPRRRGNCAPRPADPAGPGGNVRVVAPLRRAMSRLARAPGIDSPPGREPLPRPTMESQSASSSSSRTTRSRCRSRPSSARTGCATRRRGQRRRGGAGDRGPAPRPVRDPRRAAGPVRLLAVRAPPARAGHGAPAAGPLLVRDAGRVARRARPDALGRERLPGDAARHRGALQARRRGSSRRASRSRAPTTWCSRTSSRTRRSTPRTPRRRAPTPPARSAGAGPSRRRCPRRPQRSTVTDEDRLFLDRVFQSIAEHRDDLLAEAHRRRPAAAPRAAPDAGGAHPAPPRGPQVARGADRAARPRFGRCASASSPPSTSASTSATSSCRG